MADFLLELFSEEIPARMQVEAARTLQRMFEEAMVEKGLSCQPMRAYVTPRRLAIAAANIPDLQADVTLEKKGPKTSAPQAAIDGFLKSSGLRMEQLEKRMIGKDETYFAVLHHKGQPTATLLKLMIEKILSQFPWPKSMRWGSGETRWVRPLHSILCIFDGAVVPVEFAGITAGNVTYGHRFLAPECITIAAPADYAPALHKAHVIADAGERKAEIFRQAEALAGKHGLTLKPDEKLLDEVTGLVEWPTALIGRIDDSFMGLPPEVLISEMRAHQKYFALSPTQPSPAQSSRESGGGQGSGISSRFILISNMVTSDGGKAIVSGNERVLRARLSDGRFFFDQDRKKPLSAWAEGLKGVTFHAKIGTLEEKVERIKALASELAQFVPGADKTLVERAAMLCKADLVTGMVGEFPDLQGVMGRYYALAQNEDSQVADAIRDHYLPLGPDSPVPTQPVSICIALADKLDTLISMFAAGEKPTGSKDPFALRRAALGILRIILNKNIFVNPREVYFGVLLTDAILRKPDGTLAKKDDPNLAERIREMETFFLDRLKIILRDQGIRHDIVEAAINAKPLRLDPPAIRKRALALQAFLLTDNGKNLVAAYKRAHKIIAAEEKNDKITYIGKITGHPSCEEENNLLNTRTRLYESIFHSRAQNMYEEAMNGMSPIADPLNVFFDKVLVNTDDKALRIYRLNLLAYVRNTLNELADFSLLEG